MGRRKLGNLIGALLTGKALEAYTRLLEEDASNYVELKYALLKRYNLTAEGYQGKFRKDRPETEESVDQFIFHIIMEYDYKYN